MIGIFMRNFLFKLLLRSLKNRQWFLLSLADEFAQAYLQKSAELDAKLLGERKTAIRRLFLEKWLPRQPVIVEGTFNWFFLSDGLSLPKIDLVFSEVPLGVLILGPESASWEEARLSGLSKEAWERAQRDLKLLERFVTHTDHVIPLMIIRWEESASEEALYERFMKLSDPHHNSPLI
jgi:hypothetical protein